MTIKSRLEILTKTLLKLATKQILAQIDGPSGVGKTTLMNEIEKRGYSVIDLDQLDELATQEFGLDPGWKSSHLYSDKLLSKIHKIRQRLLDSWLVENDPDKTIVFGIHTEGSTKYRINAKNKILLTDDVSKIIERRVKRDDISNSDNLAMKKEILEHIKELKNLSFVPMRKEDILELFL